MSMTEQNECNGCEIGSRRDFILDALRTSALVVAALGLGAKAAEAMPVRWISASPDKTYPLPAADGVQIDKDNELILARVGKKVYAFVLACPHQNTALRWEGDDHRFKCPKHKSIYTAEGVFVEGRATRSMDRYAVKLAGSNVSVDVDKVFQEDTDKAEWGQAFVSVP